MKISKYELANEAGLQQLKLPAQAIPLEIGLEDTTLYLYALALTEDEATRSMERNTEVDQRVFLATYGEGAPDVPLGASHGLNRYLGAAGGKWAFFLGPVPKPPTV